MEDGVVPVQTYDNQQKAAEEYSESSEESHYPTHEVASTPSYRAGPSYLRSKISRIYFSSD